MANIPLPSSTFKILPEGVHIFRIYKIEYNEKFGKLKIYMVTADGYTHIERFSFLKNDGSANDGAYTSFSYFAKTTMNNSNLTSIDPYALLHRYIKIEIAHTVLPKRDNPNEEVTFTNSKNKWVADGFDKEPCEKTLKLFTDTSVKVEPVVPEPTVSKSQDFNLDALLD